MPTQIENKTLDGVLVDWAESERLYTTPSGESIYADLTTSGLVLAIEGTEVGANTTIWLDTDLDRTTGYQIWGFAGGVEYRVEIAADGTARLSDAVSNADLGQINRVRSADRAVIELYITPDQIALGQQLRLFADVNDAVFLPGDYANANLIAGDPTSIPAGDYQLDGALSDWAPEQLLYTDASGAALRGDLTADGLVLAVSSPGGVSANTTIWLDTDMDRTTGYQIWGFAGGVEYRVEIDADGNARLFDAISNVDLGEVGGVRSSDGTVIELQIASDQISLGQQVRLFADVNDAIFLPGDYANGNLIVGEPSTIQAGSYLLDGSLTDWAAEQLLYTDASGAALRADLTTDGLAIAVSSAGGVGANTTIWLATDLDRTTGYQIWGFAGGVEYRVEIDVDGNARLFDAVSNADLGAVESVRSTDGTVVELNVAPDLIMLGDQVRLFADVNDAIFLPGDYGSGNLLVGQSTSFQAGSYVLDGSLDDWAAERLLYTDAGGAAIRGDVTAEGLVLSVSSPEGVGANTTIWLDTDLDIATGYNIFGGSTGVEYRIEIDSDGNAALFDAVPGGAAIASLAARLSTDGTVLELLAPNTELTLLDQVRLYADVNNTVFLPGSYAEGLVAGDLPTYPGAPDLRVGIVYSETTAQNFYDLTAYGQLVMTAQSQAMQTGLPFDLLGEADLTDGAALAEYDVLVFPGFSHVQASQLQQITLALEIAQGSGTSFVSAGNFLTNDETGAAIAGNSYARMQDLLGVTLDSFGVTEGVSVRVGDVVHPVNDSFAANSVIDNYDTASSYLSFRDVSGNGQTLFTQDTVSGGVTTTTSAVIATDVGGNRNVHFATDALIGNSNLLHEAIDFAAKDDALLADIGMSMTRGTALFYARNDMDLSAEYFDTTVQQPGIYDVLLPILEDWYAKYDFIGSYYINVGANAPDQQTDWTYLSPFYTRLLEMGNEIGSHSYTHPEDTNLLNGDTQELLDIIARIDPDNPDRIDLSALSPSELQILIDSFRFQFDVSAREISNQLGIEVTGSAVPGAPEKLEASLEMIQYFDYLSGGYAGEGAGYPGAFGYLTPDVMDAVYLAPNMSFDFSLFQFRGLSPAEAAEAWRLEYLELMSGSDAPIISFPWHDYGPTEWIFDGQPSLYDLEVFDEFIAMAAADGVEFVTGQQLADRINAFEASELTLSRSGDVVTATVDSTASGHFSLDMEAPIASVGDWFAWDDDQVFLPREGGTFEITLGPSLDAITRISGLSDRMELVNVTGNGSSQLDATVSGQGSVELTYVAPASVNDTILVTGANGGVRSGADGSFDLLFEGAGEHTFSFEYGARNPVGTGEAEVFIGGDANNTFRGGGGADTFISGSSSDYDNFIFRPDQAGATILDFEVDRDDLIFEWTFGTGSWDSNFESSVLRSFQDFEDGTQFFQDGSVFLTLIGVSQSELSSGDIDVDFAWI